MPISVFLAYYLKVKRDNLSIYVTIDDVSSPNALLEYRNIILLYIYMMQGYDHTMLVTPVPDQSLKLSKIGLI